MTHPVFKLLAIRSNDIEICATFYRCLGMGFHEEGSWNGTVS